MSSPTERERLDQLEERIAWIETHLGLVKKPAPFIPPPQAHRAAEPPPLPNQPNPSAPPVGVSPEPAIAPKQAGAPQPVATRPVPPMESPASPHSWTFVKQQAQRAPITIPFATPAPIAKPQVQKPAQPSSKPRASSHAVEQAIGLKWTGWLGAIVLVIGAGLGVQFAYENHWFGHLPAGVRLGIVFSAGLALIAAGEYVFRKINPIPAASLFGAGIATLFVGAYAGYAYFDLYSSSTSLALMALSTLVGAAVAMRGNLVSIAVLSLIGANLAPMLVATQNAPLNPFLFYLLMMQVVALSLTTWGRGGKWWTLRGLSLSPTAFWTTALLFSNHGHEPALVVFMLLSAASFHAELILTTVRHSSDAKRATQTAGTAFALAVTAALTVGVLCFYADASRALRTEWVAGLALLSAFLGFGLESAHASLKRLGMSHRIAAAGLLVLTLPMATSGIRLEVGWALLALAFAAVWTITLSRISRYAAPIVWALGLARLAQSFFAVNALSGFDLGNTWMTVWATPIGANVVLAGVFALVGHVIAILLLQSRPQEKSGNEWPAYAHLQGLFCGIIWIAAAIVGLPHLGATGAILLYAWLLIPLDKVRPELNLARQAGGAMLLAAIKWAAVDTLAAKLSPAWTTTRPVLNWMMATGAAATVSLVAYYKVVGRSLWPAPHKDAETLRENRSAWDLIIASSIIVLMTIGFSFEIDRAIAEAVNAGWTFSIIPAQVEEFGWTILWSLSVSTLALAAALLGTKRTKSGAFSALWALVGLLAVKFVIVDTFQVALGNSPKAFPVLNLQVLAGMAVIGCLTALRIFLPPAESSIRSRTDPRWAISLLAAFLVAWMGILEIDRFIMRQALPTESFGLAWHLKNIGWNMWWCLVASFMMLIWHRRERLGTANLRSLGNTPWLTVLSGFVALVAAKYVIVDAIFWRINHAPPAGWMVLANWDIAGVVVVLAALFLPCVLPMSEHAISSGQAARVRGTSAGLAVLILLIAGTLEVDRAFGLPAIQQRISSAGLAEEVALSIFWSSFAVAALAIGFWRRLAPLRYFALTLLALTLLKVVVVDLSQIGYGYRVLSFLGLGLLLLGTSVMYGKISPRRLQPVKSSP
jgi:uncharacterized membrane protein